MTVADPSYTLAEPVEGGLSGGIMKTREDMPPYVTVYIGTPDLAASPAEVEQLGGKTIVAPTTINPGLSFALFTDPEGNVVGLLHQA